MRAKGMIFSMAQVLIYFMRAEHSYRSYKANTFAYICRAKGVDDIIYHQLIYYIGPRPQLMPAAAPLASWLWSVCWWWAGGCFTDGRLDIILLHAAVYVRKCTTPVVSHKALDIHCWFTGNYHTTRFQCRSAANSSMVVIFMRALDIVYG